jgi:uncharacterized protein (TIGR02145 family)
MVTVPHGSFTDTRDGQIYSTVKIGEQTWMAKNLNFNTNTTGSRCYNDQVSYCTTYGRLYTLAAAKTACPDGWHLPSREEWEILSNFVGGNTEDRHLKATSGWNNNWNGLDTYGFTALPGGYYTNGFNGFSSVGSEGNWWSSDESVNEGITYGIYRKIMGTEGAQNNYYWFGDNKNSLFSIRCLQD